ncbi:hypothetical protein Prudu_013555 [Prunus dulcis]|uniref:Uncharacterized protein n=1 Tax=Prunus dulcis TaxID=3755 RepID=A0A4Y1RFQ1_PRUDU|nr:hypothetical protein Prudu_013555 [Prunus dulcis]
MSIEGEKTNGTLPLDLSANITKTVLTKASESLRPVPHRYPKSFKKKNTEPENVFIIIQNLKNTEPVESSAENKENRKKLKITHCAGTKDEMKKLKNLRQTDEESVELMSDDEIYDSVLSKVVGPLGRVIYVA